MPSLPLKVQVAIRDAWTNPGSAVQKALKSLQDVLGRDVLVEPEWQLIVAELDPFYADKGNLIAIVSGIVQTWASSAVELLEDQAHESWADTLLEKSPPRLRLFLEVSTSDRGGTAWSEDRKGFVLSLPKKQVFQPAELYPTFRGELLACFDAPGKKVSLAERRAEADATGTDDWADVAAEGQGAASHAPAVANAKSRVEFFPDMASLPRPDQLFLRPPYHLAIWDRGNGVEVECSHSPSLKLLADYLKRWCRVNHHDTTNPPGVQVILEQSAFGLGEMFDRLVLTTESTRYTKQFHVTTSMVAALVEGVLGYEAVPGQGVLRYRRDSEFKKL